MIETCLSAALQLSNILNDLSIGMSPAPWPAIRTEQGDSEPDNHLESASASMPDRSSPSEYQHIHTGAMLHGTANSVSTSPHDGCTGAYEPLTQSPLTDIMSNFIANPQTNRSGSASSGVPSLVPYETYHNLDAPVRFILPIASFLLTSYLPQIHEVIFMVDDDDDKAALRDAVAREAADLPGDLGFGVAS